MQAVKMVSFRKKRRDTLNNISLPVAAIRAIKYKVECCHPPSTSENKR